MDSYFSILVIICHKSKNQSQREILNKVYHLVGAICNLKALFPNITINWVESHQNYQNTIQVKLNSEAHSIATYQIKVKGWCTSWLAWRPNWKGIWTRHINVFWWTQGKAYIDNKHNIPPAFFPDLTGTASRNQMAVLVPTIETHKENSYFIGTIMGQGKVSLLPKGWHVPSVSQ